MSFPAQHSTSDFSSDLAPFMQESVLGAAYCELARNSVCDLQQSSVNINEVQNGILHTIEDTRVTMARTAPVLFNKMLQKATDGSISIQTETVELFILGMKGAIQYIDLAQATITQINQELDLTRKDNDMFYGLRERLQYSESRVAEICDDIKVLESKNTTLENKNTALENKITALENENTALESKTIALRSYITALESKNTALESKIIRSRRYFTALEEKCMLHESANKDAEKRLQIEIEQRNKDWKARSRQASKRRRGSDIEIEIVF